MRPRRWSTDHVVAIVEAACAIVAAGYLLVLGLTAEQQVTSGRTAFDRAFPFLAAAVVLVLLGGWAIRSWRAAQRGEAHRKPDRDRGPETPPPSNQPTVARSTPELSVLGRDAVAEIVSILADAGIFRPRVPDPRDLEPPVADYGEPVTVVAVLAALHEAEYWRPGFRMEDHTAALAFDHSQVEQDAESLRAQIRDLDRLVGDGITVTAGDIDVEWVDGVGANRTRLRLTVGGTQLALDYAGAVKHSSTVIPVAVARALRTAGASGRLASLWSDQGVWIAVLPTGFDLDRLNADLGDAVDDPWEWVDEQEPHAAGEDY